MSAPFNTFVNGTFTITVWPSDNHVELKKAGKLIYSGSFEAFEAEAGHEFDCPPILITKVQDAMGVYNDD